MDTSILLTVAICTHDRSDIIVKCLNALVNQTKQRNDIAIIVIDNASNKSHQSALKQLTQTLKIDILCEPKTGLSHARNKALEYTKSEYIAYIDDDAIPDPEWIQNIINLITKESIKPAMIGGPIEPVWEIPKPKWLTEHLYAQFSILSTNQNKKGRIKTPHIFGANMILNVQTIISLGGFPTTLGRKGKALISCEETFIRQLLEHNNEYICFDKNIKVKHHIPCNRIKKTWLIKRSFWQGYSKHWMEKELRRKKISKRKLNKATMTKLLAKQFQTIQPLYYGVKIAILLGQIYAKVEWKSLNWNK